ncbi:caspase family protein [Cryobacterium sp. TMT1-3]|uniref:caspase family protein n=1 Tax=Cryobacterium sp. TMT1-3 TaxID=1259237 RepID=UPI001068D6C6|nr:caspase family protein [Cryobacterium sp. TMT1-3]TFC25049.1 caspase family protein [Cryobacterium sp. TMT1-3]
MNESSPAQSTSSTHQLATKRQPSLPKSELEQLRPHVVNLIGGKFSSSGAFATTKKDVDAIFATHLPAFAAEQGGVVPVVFYAHGGLVDEQAGLRIAATQVDWWKSNGVYPIHFVWETSLAGAITSAVGDWARGRRGWLDEAKDRVLELAARFGQGQAIWGQMKRSAEAASAGDGGARYVAEALGAYCIAHPGTISVHAVGHSAGSIFHSFFLPAALRAGVPAVETLSLLAPAVRTDVFEKQLMPLVGHGVESLALFTMTEKLERDDTCLGAYGKSLLYLVRASFEPEEFSPILGLEECLRANPVLTKLFGLSGASGSPGVGGAADIVWSKTTTGPLASRSTSTSHGGFDNDIPTMDSVARRVTGSSRIQSFPITRDLGDQLWPAPGPTAPRPAGTHHALCVGINAYPGGDALYGCVADAEAWAAQLAAAGFAVRTLLDAEATRQNILLGLLDLVASSVVGDVLVFQYAGHGTYVDDLDGDEAEAGNAEKKYDEALCPVDFREGNLIIDDDLGEIFDQLPDGVSLTAFFDSCHSGDGQRRLQLQPAEVADLSAASAPHGRRARFIIPDEQTSKNYRAKRGTPARAGKRALAREVLFSACKPTEVAYETGGHGDFTVAASLLVVPSANRLTNGEFLAKVREAFSSQPRQNPDFNGPRAAKSRVFLAPLGGAGAAAEMAGVVAAAGIPDAITALLDAAAASGGGASGGGASGAASGVGSGGPVAPAGPGSGALAGSREADAAARALAAAAFLRAAADFIDG